MTDAQYEQLSAELAAVKRLLEVLVAPQPSRRDDELITLKEAAAILHLSPETLRTRKAGTHAIPRQSSRPILFLRQDVLDFVGERADRKSAGRDVRRLKLLMRKKGAA